MLQKHYHAQSNFIYTELILLASNSHRPKTKTKQVPHITHEATTKRLAVRNSHETYQESSITVTKFIYK